MFDTIEEAIDAINDAGLVFEFGTKEFGNFFCRVAANYTDLYNFENSGASINGGSALDTIEEAFNDYYKVK